MIHIVSFHQIAITIPVYRLRTAGLPLQSIENSCIKKKEYEDIAYNTRRSNYHRFSIDIVSSQKKHLLLEPEKIPLEEVSLHFIFLPFEKIVVQNST